MKLEQMTKEEITAIYHERLTSDFIKDEIKPLGVILKAVERGTYQCLKLCGTDESADKAAGYVFLVRQGRDYLVDYLAVFRECRDRGYGSEMLRLLREYLTEARLVILEVEDPAYAADQSQREIQSRRIGFYKRNACRDTGLRVRCFGVPFQVLELGENRDLTEAQLWKVYRGIYSVVVPRWMLGFVLRKLPGAEGDRDLPKQPGPGRNTVVFDMDGTVLNTLDDLTDSVNYVLDRFGMPTRTREDYRRFFGNGIRHALECAVPEGTPDSAIEEMLPVFKEHYDRHCLDKTGPYEGILDLMKTLAERGYRMAIVSNKIDSAVKELNDRFFSDYISVAIGEKPGIRRKPAPDTVLAALEELGVSPEEAVYVGDSEVDFRTAVNSGMPCITVLWGFRDKDYLEDIGASIFAETPGEVADVLETINQSL